jgi:alanyl aminopeptidase
LLTTIVRRVAIVVATVVFALVADLAVAAESSVDPAPPELRIPAGARPLRYDVQLTVTPGDADVAAEIAIDVELDKPHSLLWLNAVDLVIGSVSVDVPGTAARVAVDRDQFLGIAFEPPLATGRHRVTIAYRAPQHRKSSRGIFTVQDGDASYTMTHFEPMAARQAFPCFDEPGFKAPWQLTLRVPSAMIAVSNTPVLTESDAGDGAKVVRFAPTKPLPSYLVAFAVGPWDVVSAGALGRGPTPMRLIAAHGRNRSLAFAARTFPELFEIEERWFGIDYPFAKLDHVAIPLAVRFAMENAGMITYGAPILLQPGEATPTFRHIVASIAAHEIAHQWFGNLVTMAWWDDTWLNEAFATWFAAKMVNAWRPDYERGAQRVHDRADAIEADRLLTARRIREPIQTRGDIFGAFDSITYEKGATVIGMFETWVGSEPFRRGVRNYLEQHRYGSATVTDFLDALTAASGKPVAPAFATFLDQNGVPEVSVALACTGGRAQLRLAQRRYAVERSAAPDQLWQIPICARYRTHGATHIACTLLTEREGSLPVGFAFPDFVIANAGGNGYYVPVYSADLAARLARHRRDLTPGEYASALYDLRPLVRAGSVTTAQAFEWIAEGAHSNDRHVMLAAIALASFVRDELVSDDARANFAAFVSRQFGPRARALGFTPRRGERDDNQLLRRSLLAFVGPEDPVLAAQARKLAVAWIADRKAVDVGLADTVLLIAARTGDATLFDAMQRELRATQNQLDRRNLLIALYSFGDPALAQRGLSLLLDSTIDIRDATTALSLAAARTPPSRTRHAFIADHFDGLAARVDADAPGGWPGYAEGLCTAADRASVAAFWEPRLSTYASAARNLAQTLESIDACTRLRERERGTVAALLAASARSAVLSQ